MEGGGGYVLSLEGEQVWLQYKYERLPLFCHSCGRLGHLVQSCTHIALPTDEIAVPVLPYGEWLWALPNNRPIFQLEVLTRVLGPLQSPRNELRKSNFHHHHRWSKLLRKGQRLKFKNLQITS